MGKPFVPSGNSKGNFRRQDRNDQGPPDFVVPYAKFMHQCEGNFLVQVTDKNRFPKFNKPVYLENKAKVGVVDEILGTLTLFYFSVKPVPGVKPNSFKPDQVLYMSPDDLLSMDRLTAKSKPKPRGPPGQKGPPGAQPWKKFPPGGNKFGGGGGGNKFGGQPKFQGGARKFGNGVAR